MARGLAGFRPQGPNLEGTVAGFAVAAEPATVIRYFDIHSCLGGNDDVPQPVRFNPGRRVSRSASGAADRVRSLGLGPGGEKS
jgi:hypothetical protein